MKLAISALTLASLLAALPAQAAGKAAPAPAAKKTAPKADDKKSEEKKPEEKAGEKTEDKPAEQGAADKASADLEAAKKAAAEDKKTVAPSEHKEPPNPFAGLGRNKDEQVEYDDLAKSLAEYEEQAREFRGEVQLLIEKKYDEKRKGLEASYEKAISDIEVLERKERLDAIAMFEEFLTRYPNEPKYTPDVMFRLAELYYEKTKDDYSVAMKDYEEQLKLFEEKKLAVAPNEPKQNFQKSIDLYQRLITGFPEYRLNDGSHYLLGFCLEKQGEFEQSRDTFQRLISKYPTSRFVPEAWVRIGEYWFDAPDDDALPKAAQAYSQATKFKDSVLYDKALYKLGWTYYRMDDFERATGTFVALVDYYQQKSQEAGEDEAGGDLRNEALQYMAISLTDEKWGSVARGVEFFGKIGPRPWEGEVWRRMGDVYYDQTHFDDAVASYKHFIEKDPTAKDAPQIQDKIVKAYETGLRDMEKASAERDVLVKNYGPGTKWYEHWKGDSDVIKASQELSEKSLLSAAYYHHQQAVAFIKGAKYDLGKREYEIAAKSYADYLSRFPHSKLAYELQFYLGECLYSSFQYLEAARVYEKVRDSNEDTKYQADAAYAAVLSYQKEIDAQQKATPPTLETKPVLTSKDRGEDAKIEKKDLPELWKRFVSAGDGFLKHVPKHEKAAQIAYRAAETYYVYDDFEEARRRFEFVAEHYPDSEFAKYASNLTIETYLITKDWNAIIRIAGDLTKPGKDGKTKVDPNSDAGKVLSDLGDNAMFKQAEKLMAEEKWDDAGKMYEDLVEKNKGYKYADKALNNAAVCREKGRRFDSALKLYERIFREYPTSDIAPIALFRVAVNAEKSYDFDKAVSRYKELVEKYPQSKDRAAALNNLGILLEGLQRYQEAAKQFTRYAELFPSDEDAPKNLYKAATIYEKMNDCNGQIRALSEFVRKFSGDSKQSERVVDAEKRIGDCYLTLKNEKAAHESWAKAADEYKRRNLSGSDVAASAAAAYARFQLAEVEFKKWDSIVINGRGKQLEKSFTDKKKKAKDLQDAYGEVYAFKSVEWILAASFKKGFVLERFANSLIEAPCPPDVKRIGEDACDEYKQQLIGLVTGLEEKAAESYDATLKECRNFKLVDNEWCDRTQEGLARYRAEYKVLKKAKSLTVDSALYPASLVETLEGPRVVASKAMKAGKLGDEDSTPDAPAPQQPQNVAPPAPAPAPAPAPTNNGQTVAPAPQNVPNPTPPFAPAAKPKGVGKLGGDE